MNMRLANDNLWMIGRHLTGNDVLSFVLATKHCVKENDVPIFNTNIYLTATFNTIEEYKKILFMIRPKIGGSTLLYHIRKKNIEILRYLCDHCFTYFNKTHLLAAIQTTDLNIISIVCEHFVTQKPLNISHCNHCGHGLTYDVIELTSYHNAFDILEYIIKKLNFNMKEVYYQSKFIINRSMKNSIVLYYYLQMPSFNERPFYYIKNILLLKDLEEKGLHVTCPEQVFLRGMSHYYHGTKEIISEIELIKWIVAKCGNMTSEEFSSKIFKLFIAATYKNVRTSLWLYDNGFIDKRAHFCVKSIEAYMALKHRGHTNIVRERKAIASTIACQKQYMAKYKGTKLTNYVMMNLLYDNSHKMFMMLFDHFSGSQKDYQEFFGIANLRVIKFMLARGHQINFPEQIFIHRINCCDFECAKFIHILFPKMNIDTVLKNEGLLCADPKIFKWVYGNFEVTFDVIVNSMYQFIRWQKNVEMANICYHILKDLIGAKDKLIFDPVKCIEIKMTFESQDSEMKEFLKDIFPFI